MAGNDMYRRSAGSIEVTVISATLIPRGGSKSDSADSYATVIFGRQQFSTKVARGHGALPVWNEKLSFDFDRNGNKEEDLIVQIYAVEPEAPRLQAVARLPLFKVVEAREETSLLPLHQPSEGYECGQVKVTLKLNSLVNKTAPSIYAPNEEIHSSAAHSYPPPTTQKSLPHHPEMSSNEGYGAAPWGDSAAHALSALSLDKGKEQRSGEGPPSSYPPSMNTLNPYAPQQQGLPYLASPISGVVTGTPDAPPSPAYTYPRPSYDTPSDNRSHAEQSSSSPYVAPTAPPQPGSYPPSSNHPSASPYPSQSPQGLNLPENLDVFTGGKEQKNESSYPPQYHGGAPAPNSEGGYPPAPSQYPPQYNESIPGSQGFPDFSPYGVTAAAPAVPYPQPGSHDGQGKEKTKKEFEFPAPKYDGAPPPQSGYPPSEGYPPSSGPHDPSGVPTGYPPQQTSHQSPPATGYPGQHVQPGELTSESTVTSSSEGAAAVAKGFKKNQQHGYGGGYAQPGYAQPGYAQPGYGHQPGYPQPGYGQQPTMYPQAGYGSNSYAPNYPPAYPAHGYAPESYPSHGYGGHGYTAPYAHGGGHGGSHHAPAPYGAAYGAPMYGGHGHYKQHKGGHKGYKHKKMKKMKKGHYLHYEQSYGNYGGHYGGKHGKYKHKK